MSQPNLIDLSRDPLVVVTAPPVGTPGRADRYHVALEWLIGRGKPFVLITQADGNDETESADDRKARALWFKREAENLVRVCMGFVYIEPDEAKRAIWQTRAAAMAGAFPVPMRIASDLADALAMARALVPSAAK
jgi:hypothetical protein